MEQITHQQQHDAMQQHIEDQARIIAELSSEMKGLRIRLQRAHAQEGDNDGG